MKKNVFAIASFVCLLFAAEHAAAAPQLTSARITKVSATSQRDSGGFGPMVLLTIQFDRNINSGCTSNNSATFAVFALADNAQRDLAMQAMEGLRNVAVSAFLSGRMVEVHTLGGCSLIGTHTLDFITLK